MMRGVIIAKTPARGRGLSALEERRRRGRRVAFCLALAAGSVEALAGISWSLDGATLSVTAPSTYAGKAIQLVWGQADGAWANTNTVCDAVAAGGGTYTCDLKAAGIANGTELHLQTCHRYQVLDKIYQPYTLYIDTGMKDSDVYGVRAGFCLEQELNPTATSAVFKNILGTDRISSEKETIQEGGFTFGFRKAVNDVFQFYWTGKSNTEGTRPDVPEGKMLDIAFTNSVRTLYWTDDGGQRRGDVKSGLDLSPVGRINDYVERTMYVGRRNLSGDSRPGQGWWAYVQFDGNDGELLLDYVPVRDCATGEIGFFDRAAAVPGMVATSGSGSFAVSSSGGDKTGEATGEYIETGFEALSSTITPDRELTFEVEGSVLAVTVPAGLAGEELYLLWDDADMGADPADWAHCEKIGSTARLGRLGVRNGQFIRVAAANRYTELERLHAGSQQCYVDTGIKDTEIYAIRLGFMPTGKSAAFGTFIGAGNNDTSSYEDRRGSFYLAANNESIDSVLWTWRGEKSGSANRPAISTEAINEIVFADGAFTIGGEKQYDIAPGAAGTLGNYTMCVCRSNVDSRMEYGWWAYASFEDEDGTKILDYIPVKRSSDGKVGFYDRVAKTFAASSGTGDFTAGPEKAGTETTAFNSVGAAMKISSISGLVISIH